MGKKKKKSLHRILMEMKIELLIQRKKLDKFEEEVAVNSVIHAVTEAIKVLEED